MIRITDTLSRLREKLAKRDEGFTLIELLVVVVIIGVLVAIAVPVYLSYREGAADRSAQSDIRGTISAMEQYYTDNQNKYPTSLTEKKAEDGPIDLDGAGPATTKVSLSAGTTITINVTGGAYAICATNSGGSNEGKQVYYYSNQKGGSVSKAPTGISLTSCTP